MTRARVQTAAWAVLVVATTVVGPNAHAASPLDATAHAIAHDLGAAPHDLLVVGSPVTSDVAAPRGDELSARIAALVAGAVGSGARSEAHPMSLPGARARAGAARPGGLLYLEVRVEGGELRVNADVYPIVTNGWDRARTPPPPPSAHAFVHAAVTAEVRAYLAPLHLERAQVTRFKHDFGPLLAVACADLEGAGGNDLVLVSEHEVGWGQLRGDAFVPAKRVPADALGRRAPVPWREPLAMARAVDADGPGALFVAWSDRVGTATGKGLERGTPLAGLPVALGEGVACVIPDAARGGFEDALVRCDDGGPSPGGALSASPTLFDAWVAFDLVGADGHVARVVGAREPSATLHLWRAGAGARGNGTTDSLSVNDVGAQIALADLDQDGIVEVVTTTSRPRGEEDALVVSSWTEDGLAQRLRWSAPAGVDAVAVCPPEANDAPSLVAAVGSEIWLVR
jgi:hypothetical protein